MSSLGATAAADVTASLGGLDVQRKDDGVWLSAPGTKPTGGRPPAGWRPSHSKGSPVTEPPASEPPAPTETAQAGQP